jgi:hypothetical protein
LAARVAPDQNFPGNLVAAIAGAVPPNIELTSIRSVDARLSDMGDRQMIIALSQLGFDAMVSDDRHILSTPEELPALLATRLGFVCIRAAGDNSVKAACALLLELSNLPRVFQDKKRRVLDLHYEPWRAGDAWDYMKRIADRTGITAEELYASTKPSDSELARPVLSCTQPSATAPAALGSEVRRPESGPRLASTLDLELGEHYTGVWSQVGCRGVTLGGGGR